MKLILIDGYGFVFRAFHSLPPLTRPKDGLPIGAVLGFTNMLYKFITQNASDMIAVVLDSGQKNFRHEIYPQYKRNRPETPKELILQFPIIREAIEAFNIKVLEKIGYEADDLIASYAKEAIARGYEVLVVSSDKDLMQLLAHGIKMFDAMKDKEITEEDVIKKFGIKSDKLRDALALIGDASDNIPGVRTIGPKTAAELLDEYGSLENIYQNIDNIQQVKRKQVLLEDKDNAFLSYRLIGLIDEVSLDFDLKDLKEHILDKAKLSHFLAEQGFKTLLNRINVTAKTAMPSDVEFKELRNISEITKLISDIEYHGCLYLYAESNQITLTFGESNYLLKLEKGMKQESLFELETTQNNYDLVTILTILRPIFESKAIKIISINIKEVFKSLLKLGVEAKACEDIAIIAYAIETGVGDGSFDNLIERFGLGLKNKNSHTIKVIYQELVKKLLEVKHVTLYERLDKLMLEVLAKIEFRGVKIDVAYLKSLSGAFSIKIKNLEERIFKIVGREFNIGSPKQLGDILFGELKLASGKKTKTGAFVTSAQVLEGLDAEGYEIAGLVLDWRQYSKLVSTYTDALPRAVDPKSGRIHTTFTMTSTATGRLSSNDPNLQNIPIRTEEGYKIRKAFIAEQGSKIISADYSQIELRLLAHFADIGTLKDAFKYGHDIHAITASQIFNIPIEAVNSTLRRQAKTINFGIIYGISAYGLARRLDISREVAAKYIENYFIQYPGIKEYMNKMIDYARKHGYIETYFGRKCYLLGINDKNQIIRGNSERGAINFPLQGTAADIIKKAMVKLPDIVSRYMILQIHDELLFEVPNDEVNEAIKIIKKTMEQAVKLSVPVTVDVKSGDNWMESH